MKKRRVNAPGYLKELDVIFVILDLIIVDIAEFFNGIKITT